MAHEELTIEATDGTEIEAGELAPQVVITNAEAERYTKALGGRVRYAGDGTEADPASEGTLIASEDRRNIKKCRYDVQLDDGRLVRELDLGTLASGGRWSVLGGG